MMADVLCADKFGHHFDGHANDVWSSSTVQHVALWLMLPLAPLSNLTPPSITMLCAMEHPSLHFHALEA